MEIQEYYYYYADTFLDATAQIYLECSYDKASYAEETKRLSETQEEYKGAVQSIVYDTEVAGRLHDRLCLPAIHRRRYRSVSNGIFAREI